VRVGDVAAGERGEQGDSEAGGDEGLLDGELAGPVGDGGFEAGGAAGAVDQCAEGGAGQARDPALVGEFGQVQGRDGSEPVVGRDGGEDGRPSCLASRPNRCVTESGFIGCRPAGSKENT
jgi:hypothetical protein